MGIIKNTLGTLSSVFSLGREINKVELRNNTGILEGKDNSGSYKPLVVINDQITDLDYTWSSDYINSKLGFSSLTERKFFSNLTTVIAHNHDNYLFVNNSIKWISPFIVNLPFKQYATDGYFTIDMPGLGINIDKNDSSYITTTSDGIPLLAGESLVYKLPFGQGNSTINSNFLIVKNNVNFDNTEDYITLFTRKINGNDINIINTNSLVKTYIDANKVTPQNLTGQVTSKIIYDNINIDSKNQWDTSLSRFTNDKSNQVVNIIASFSLPEASNNRRGNIMIYKNGNMIFENCSVLTGRGYVTLHLNFYVNLDINDYIEVYGFHDSESKVYEITCGFLQIITV